MDHNISKEAIQAKISAFEKKYGCSLHMFRKRIEENEEDSEQWNDYIEWKAYYELGKNL